MTDSKRDQQAETMVPVVAMAVDGVKLEGHERKMGWIGLVGADEAEVAIMQGDAIRLPVLVPQGPLRLDQVLRPADSGVELCVYLDNAVLLHPKVRPLIPCKLYRASSGRIEYPNGSSPHGKAELHFWPTEMNRLAISLFGSIKSATKELAHKMREWRDASAISAERGELPDAAGLFSALSEQARLAVRHAIFSALASGKWHVTGLRHDDLSGIPEAIGPGNWVRPEGYFSPDRRSWCIGRHDRWGDILGYWNELKIWPVPYPGGPLRAEVGAGSAARVGAAPGEHPANGNDERRPIIEKAMKLVESREARSFRAAALSLVDLGNRDPNSVVRPYADQLKREFSEWHARWVGSRK